MDGVNKVISQEQLQVGDEVIVRGQDLNYMEIIRPPKQKQKQYKIGNQVNNYTVWASSKCKRMNGTMFMNNSKWDKDVHFDFTDKSIWLVKRIGINK